MKTCKDCLHCEACNGWMNEKALEQYVIDNDCEDFTARFEWVHLPCKVGDTVYFITSAHTYNRLIKSAVILEIVIDEDGIKDVYVREENTYCFEHSFDIFYMTREEAEKALERMKDE